LAGSADAAIVSDDLDNPWTFAGQEGLRERRTAELDFLTQCRLHDALWESARLFGANPLKTETAGNHGSESAFRHLHDVWDDPAL
jgi:hypothetical protein